jgi:adenine phosphoribosyltransferase
MLDLATVIRDIPDFPKPGIIFKDITTLLAHPQAMKQAVDEMQRLFDKDKVDAVLGIESRGFIFAAMLALRWEVPMIPVRKPGKLPFETISESYTLEYGTDSLEMHVDALQAGQNVLIVDDLLATGGTVRATAKLVEKLGANVVGCCFLIELDFLNARKQLQGYRIESLIHDDAE